MKKEILTEYLQYIDDEGHEFEMEVIKRFAYEKKKYVLLSEHDHGENCCCHDEKHHHDSIENNVESAVYIFESVDGAEGEKLIPVSEETLEKIERLL